VQNITTVGGRTVIPGDATTFADTVQLAANVGFTVLTDNWSPTDTFGGATWCSDFGLGGNTMYADTNNIMHPWRPDYLNRNVCAHNPAARVVYVDHAIPDWLRASPPPLSDANFDVLKPWFEAALQHLDGEQVNAWGFVSHQVEYDYPGTWTVSPDALAALDRFLTYIDSFVAQGNVRYATARDIAERFVQWEGSQTPTPSVTPTPTPTPTPAVSTWLISGKKLWMSDKPKIVVLSADPSITSPGPDDPAAPTLGGGLLEVVNPATGESDAFPLPAANWKGTGSPAGSRGYTYTDSRQTAGPCKSVKIWNGKRLSARCHGAQIAFSLDEASQSSLGVKLTLGNGDRYCMLFGGTIVKDEPGLFKAKDAPAPAACP
jgi:hypothetical protein